jgi:hypothetical protein
MARWPHAWRQGRLWRGGHRRPLGNTGAVLGAACWRLARIRAVIVRTASGSSCVAPWPAAAEAVLSS